jgi:DNA modification methylase/site-specific DNA-cytosine methylase
MTALFNAYPSDIIQHVIDAMTPRIESEIKRVHEAVEKAKAIALVEALAPLAAKDKFQIEQPPPEPEPPTPVSPKRRTSWDGMSAEQRSSVVKSRWAKRKANAVEAGQTQKPNAVEGPDRQPTSVNAIRYASVCSGVEGLSLAWEPLGGFTPVFFSEIEAFPSAVLAKRWPKVPNLGDLTKIEGCEWKGKLDVLWASLPCQSFSLTGNRKGAKDERGAMFRPFLQLADDIDPPVVIMENVVGLRSDPVFREILGSLAGAPFQGEVPKTGSHDGPTRRLAWAVLDSGTEQRRQRLFLVACSLASGIDPASILPEPNGFPTPRGKAHQTSGASPQGSVVWLNADTTPKWSDSRVGTLRAAGGSGGRSLVAVNGRVRELMPEERERLMGWDGQHTAIDWKGTERTLDRLRNQAIGNSLALLPVRAIGEKLKAALLPAQILRGDCIEVMPTLADGSVDLVITSPPYPDHGMEYGDAFGSIEDYIEFSRNWLSGCARLLRPGGSLWVNVGYEKASEAQRIPLTYHLFPLLKEIGLEMMQEVVWEKPAAMNAARQRLTVKSERWMWLYRPGAKPTFNLDPIRVAPLTSDPRNHPLGSNPADVWRMMNVPGNSKERVAHPCQFPKPLIERIVRACSNPGETVLDPFAGSGTTGLVAAGLGRRSIMIERHEEYWPLIEERLEAA